MTKIFSKRQRTAAFPAPLRKASDSRLLPFFLFFSLGIVLGTFFGLSGGAAEAALLHYSPSNDLFEIFLRSSILFLLLLLFSTSYLGALFIPALLVVRGCIFSCAVTAMYSSGGSEGLLLALRVSVVPMAMILPAFFLVSADCMQLAVELFRLRFSRPVAVAAHTLGVHIPAAMISIILDFSYCAYILPLI